MLLMISPRVHFCILQHGLEGEVVVDTLQALYKGIGDDHLCIRTSLGSSIAVATTGIRHVSLSLVDIQQGIHDVGLSLFVEQGDEWGGGAIGVPDGVVVVVVGTFRPLGVLARLIHRHQHRMVKGCIEHALVSLAALDLNLAELLLPALAYLI